MEISQNWGGATRASDVVGVEQAVVEDVPGTPRALRGAGRVDRSGAQDAARGSVRRANTGPTASDTGTEMANLAPRRFQRVTP
jgi:hypothetical protein